jgi:penicillin-binding protein 1C
MEYYYKQKNYDYKTLPAFKAGCNASAGSGKMELIYPQPGAKIYVPLEMNGEKGRTVFTAAHRNPSSKIFWTMDDQFLTTTEQKHQVAVSPSAGMHTITLTDEEGHSISRNFEILNKEK